MQFFLLPAQQLDNEWWFIFLFAVTHSLWMGNKNPQKSKESPLKYGNREEIIRVLRSVGKITTIVNWLTAILNMFDLNAGHHNFNKLATTPSLALIPHDSQIVISCWTGGEDKLQVAAHWWRCGSVTIKVIIIWFSWHGFCIAMKLPCFSSQTAMQ